MQSFVYHRKGVCISQKRLRVGRKDSKSLGFPFRLDHSISRPVFADARHKTSSGNGGLLHCERCDPYGGSRSRAHPGAGGSCCTLRVWCCNLTGVEIAGQQYVCPLCISLYLFASFYLHAGWHNIALVWCGQMELKDIKGRYLVPAFVSLFWRYISIRHRQTFALHPACNFMF